MRTLETLAEFVCRLSPGDIPAASRAMARHCMLDLVGAAVAGATTPAAGALRRLARHHYAPGPATVWFAADCRVAAAAALANSAAAAALDIDDGHRLAGGHPGASIIPAVLATAEETGADGTAVLAAVVIGYEIAIRVAAARDFSRLDTLSTGRWCAYGAAAAAAWLKGLSSADMVQAMAVAGVLSPGLSAAGYSKVMGNHVKEGIPWATRIGLEATAMAADGVNGPTDILDHPDYYDAPRIVADLGRRFAIDRVYFKPYACCRWIHSALDALSDLMAEHRIMAGEIESIRVDTFARAMRLNPYPDPDSLEAGQYSLPFCLAVLAVEGPGALLPMIAASLHQPATVALAHRVTLTCDPVLNDIFPQKAPARVTVAAKGRTHLRQVIDPLGDPDHPMDRPRLEEKFRRLTRHRLDAELQDRTIAAIDAVETQGLAALLKILQACRGPNDGRRKDGEDI